MKGSRYWMQELVNTRYQEVLDKEICEVIGRPIRIEWLSPIQKENYIERQLPEIKKFRDLDYSFWPEKGPMWDAIGVASNGALILVEAKSHIDEMSSSCKARSKRSIDLIKKTMGNTHKDIGRFDYNEDLWYHKFYQFGNRVSWYHNLKKQDVDVILIFLNFVNDYTHIKTSRKKWEIASEALQFLMLGYKTLDENIHNIMIDVSSLV